jgi:hypothetical protein
MERLEGNDDSQISRFEPRKDDKLTATFAAVDTDGVGFLTAQLNDRSPQHATDRSGY